MDCNGKVLSVEKEIARVLVKPEGCGGCTACHIGSMIKSEPIEVNALNEAEAETGDLVHLEIPGRKIIEGSLILFMIPFAGFLAGFLAGYYPVWFITRTSREPIALACGFVLLVLSYILVRYLGEKSGFEYVVREVVSKNGETTEDSPPAKDEIHPVDGGPAPVL